jgi:hypothetical protein
MVLIIGLDVIEGLECLSTSDGMRVHLIPEF